MQKVAQYLHKVQMEAATCRRNKWRTRDRTHGSALNLYARVQTGEKIKEWRGR